MHVGGSRFSCTGAFGIVMKPAAEPRSPDVIELSGRKNLHGMFSGIERAGLSYGGGVFTSRQSGNANLVRLDLSANDFGR